MPAVRGVQKIGQMAGEELAATMMGQRPNSMMSKVVPQPLFAVAPEQGLLSTKVEPIESLLQTKPQAPVSDIGFYSATEQAALNLGRNKGTGQSFINDLMKAPDVKKEELAYTGLDDFLRDKPNVTKQEVQDFLANNRVEVREVALGAPMAEDPIGIAKRKEVFDKYEPEIQRLSNELDNPNTYASGNHIKLLNEYNRVQDARNIEADAAYMIPEALPTKYDKYQLAGGENYREILLTLPPKNVTEQTWQVLKADGTTTTGYFTSEEAARRDAGYIGGSIRQSEPVTYQSGYRSSHFNEPNILAHMRVNDRIDADGKKMLLVEEIQSDWHQAGREKGYRKEGSKQALEAESKAIGDERNKLVKELSEQEKKNGFVSIEGQQQWDAFKEKENLFKQKSKDFSSQAPDAPFKDTWYQLALKRLTKYAADNGYERIGLTTGKQQAERFDLSKQLSRVGYRDGRLQGYDNDGALVMSKSVDPKELPDYVGKELGQKIAVNAEKDAEIRKALRQAIKDDLPEDQIDALRNQLNAIPEEYSGLDLQVGGEGMKKYYDEIYPKFLDKYGKKYGAKVGETQITTGYARDADGIPAQRPSKETIRYLDVTPQMKEGTSKGQPLFAATPLLPATSLLDEEKRKEITSLLE
jgi:hypothetical protein